MNELTLTRSFILAPNNLVEDWDAGNSLEIAPGALAPLLALNPELILLGTGDRQRFPSAATMAECLTRGIGIEVMTNASAARTFNVLAGEGRRVVAGFLLASS